MNLTAEQAAALANFLQALLPETPSTTTLPPPQPGHSSPLKVKVLDELMRDGSRRDCDIAAVCKCSDSTVQRVRTDAGLPAFVPRRKVFVTASPDGGRVGEVHRQTNGQARLVAPRSWCTDVDTFIVHITPRRIVMKPKRVK